MELFHHAEELRQQGAHEAAIQTFLESFSLDDTNWPALNNAASIYLNMLKMPEKAEPLFRQALELSYSPQVARNLELCQQSLQRNMRKKKRRIA
jgi:tetratricopeptide (TPR) repeat protein